MNGTIFIEKLVSTLRLPFLNLLRRIGIVLILELCMYVFLQKLLLIGHFPTSAIKRLQRSQCRIKNVHDSNVMKQPSLCTHTRPGMPIGNSCWKLNISWIDVCSLFSFLRTFWCVCVPACLHAGCSDGSSTQFSA